MKGDSEFVHLREKEIPDRVRVIHRVTPLGLFWGSGSRANSDHWRLDRNQRVHAKYRAGEGRTDTLRDQPLADGIIYLCFGQHYLDRAQVEKLRKLLWGILETDVDRTA